MTYLYTDPVTGLSSERKVYFPRPQAQIPVKTDEGETLCQWGRRSEQEDPESEMPITGWARLEKIESAFWQRYSPEQVLIPALAFCEKPAGFDKSLWYPPMKPGTFLMGLKLEAKGRPFVYVVTRPPERIFRDIDRVPVIVDRAFSIQAPLELELQGQMDLFGHS